MRNMARRRDAAYAFAKHILRKSQMPASRRLRVLLSEGSSTSAREAITALGLDGHLVEICDPNPFCIGRFSRFLHRFHRCPGLGTDPEGYLAFILDLLSRERFDVLLPIHEQGFLFAKIQQRLTPRVAVALPSFESYERAHSKTGFRQVLSELGLPQPETAVIAGPADLRVLDRFPFVVKTAIGTASRGTWTIHDAGERERAMAEIDRARRSPICFWCRSSSQARSSMRRRCSTKAASLECMSTGNWFAERAAARP